MNHQELIERMRGFEIDHEPNGWPAIQMRDISAMCDAIESLLNALDVADSEVKRTVADRDELKNKNALLSAHVELYGDEARRLDDLLAALERFMDSHEECTDFDGFAAQIVSMADCHQAQEAIARAKGEQ